MRGALIVHEEEQVRRARCGGDVLYKDFRDDVICISMGKFKSLGITFEKLIKWQARLPFIYPFNTEYNTLRLIVNLRFSVFPLIISMCESDSDVVGTFKIAKKYKIPIAIRSGSHAAEPYDTVSDGIIIDQSKRKGVTPLKGSARFESGCLLGPVADALSKENLVIASGTCSNNGLFGYSLGGGIGALSRLFGMAVDNIISAKVLLADGEIHDVRQKDLLFALRGAGNGNYGVVTELTVKTHRVKNVLYYKLVYPLSSLFDVLKVWQTIAPGAPRTIGSELNVRGAHTPGGTSSNITPPSSDNNKDNGESLPTDAPKPGDVIVTGCYVLYPHRERGVFTKWIQPLLELSPTTTEMKKMKYIDFARIAAGKGRWLPYWLPRSTYFAEPIPDDVIHKIVRMMKVGSSTNVLELNAMGGAIDDVGVDETAFVHRGMLFWLLINAHWADVEQQPREVSWTNNLFNKIFKHSSGQCYQNMFDAQLREKALGCYYGSNLDRLREIKKKYDPENVFSYHQSIPPAGI